MAKRNDRCFCYLLTAARLRWCLSEGHQHGVSIQWRAPIPNSGGLSSRLQSKSFDPWDGTHPKLNQENGSEKQEMPSSLYFQRRFSLFLDSSQPLYFHFALAVNSVNTNQNWNFVAEISFEEKAREGWLRKLLVLRRFWLYIDVCILRIQKRSRYILRELALLVVLARIDLKKKKLAQLLLQTVA